MYNLTVKINSIPEGELVEVDGLGLFPNKVAAPLTDDIIAVYEASHDLPVVKALKDARFTLTKVKTPVIEQPAVPTQSGDE